MVFCLVTGAGLIGSLTILSKKRRQLNRFIKMKSINPFAGQRAADILK